MLILRKKLKVGLPKMVEPCPEFVKKILILSEKMMEYSRKRRIVTRFTVEYANG